jgi:PmbA protein
VTALRFDREAARLLEGARAAGAEEAEAFFHHGVELTVKVHDAEVEQLTAAEARGVGLRVFGDARMGFAYTSDLSDDGLGRVVTMAVEACRYNGPDPSVGLPDIAPDGDIEGLEAADFEARDLEARVAMALDLERLAASHHPEVRRVDIAVYGDERGHTELHTTRGVAEAYAATVAYAYVVPLAERGEEMQSGWSLAVGRSAPQIDLAAVATEGAERAAALLGARQLPSRTSAVVIEPWAAAALMGTLASSISAEAVQKGRSLLAGRLEEVVASPVFTLVDDGWLLEGLASRPWDDEGVPTQRTPVIESGVLRAYLHNSYTARRDGSARSTGNASRGSYRSTPELAPSNLVVLPGIHTKAELLATMGEGILITEVHGLHTVNPVTGEFSLGINGFLVEAGEPTVPVREMTVAGDLLGLLTRVADVGSDLRFTIGSGFLGAPSLLVSDVAVSGA